MSYGVVKQLLVTGQIFMFERGGHFTTDDGYGHTVYTFTGLIASLRLAVVPHCEGTCPSSISLFQGIFIACRSSLFLFVFQMR
jgi:hypothetical protein